MITIPIELYQRKKDSELKSDLSTLQFEVTQNSATERPFANVFWNFYEKGIYVDITSGEPLFSSLDKFESSCGWPSFSKPIHPDVVTYVEDLTFRMNRIEVRSRVGDAHLGHVFDDGPRALGGKRYCINSASLAFVPFDELDSRGYGYLSEYFL